MKTILILLVALIAAAMPVRAQTPPDMTPAQIEAIERIVRDYLRRNPDVVIDALQEFEDRQRAGTAERRARLVAERAAEIFDDKAAPSVGDRQADVTIVEFFDFRCPYCRQMVPTIAELLKQDRKVRILYRDFPILAPDSRTAALAALAAHAQGKYSEMHAALMRGRMPFDEANVLRIAGEVGLDTRRLKRDMDSPAIAAAIERNQALARALEINGTPAYIIGGRIIAGAMELSDLQKLVAAARAK